MAAFTPAGVKAAANSTPTAIPANEAITAGNAVSPAGKVVDPSSADTDDKDIAGVAIADAANGGSAVILSKGMKVTVTNTLTYPRQIIAAPSGQLQYDDDLTTGHEYIIVGYTEDANTIYVDPRRANVSAP